MDILLSPLFRIVFKKLNYNKRYIHNKHIIKEDNQQKNLTTLIQRSIDNKNNMKNIINKTPFVFVHPNIFFILLYSSSLMM